MANNSSDMIYSLLSRNNVVYPLSPGGLMLQHMRQEASQQSIAALAQRRQNTISMESLSRASGTKFFSSFWNPSDFTSQTLSTAPVSGMDSKVHYQQAPSPAFSAFTATASFRRASIDTASTVQGSPPQTVPPPMPPSVSFFTPTDAEKVFKPRARRTYIPAKEKDTSYWLQRKKNNESAKMSRLKRRVFELNLEQKLAALIEENQQLKVEVEVLRAKYEPSSVGTSVASSRTDSNFPSESLGGLSSTASSLSRGINQRYNRLPQYLPSSFLAMNPNTYTTSVYNETLAFPYANKELIQKSLRAPLNFKAGIFPTPPPPIVNGTPRKLTSISADTEYPPSSSLRTWSTGCVSPRTQMELTSNLSESSNSAVSEHMPSGESSASHFSFASLVEQQPSPPSSADAQTVMPPEDAHQSAFKTLPPKMRFKHNS